MQTFPLTRTEKNELIFCTVAIIVLFAWAMQQP